MAGAIVPGGCADRCVQERGWKHGVVRVRVCGQKKSHNSDEAWLLVQSGGLSKPGLTDRQAQRHKEIVPESFFALEKLKYVNALSLPISGGSTPLLRRAGSKGGA